MHKQLSLGNLSSIDLICRIVHQSDKSCLEYLLENRRFFYYGSRHLLLSEFVWKLREKTIKSRDFKRIAVDEVDDAAYDLTIKKFANLPSDMSDMENVENSYKKLKRKQVDCRNYYRVVLSRVEKWKEGNPDASELDEERMVGIILQQLVVKHYFLSRLEFLRKKRPFSVRYIYRVGRKSISLWYPAGLRAEAIRDWIGQNILNAKADVSEEQSRLQAELDNYFYQGTLSIDVYADSKIEASTQPVMNELDNSLPAPKLAKAVVSEKLNHFVDLRPAIKKLGKNMLSQLIYRIFDDLNDDRYEDSDIANDFGLSKATFSRFAGSRWKGKPDESKAMAVPDLWKNTARVIAADSDFCESAQEAGFMPEVKKILK